MSIAITDTTLWMAGIIIISIPTIEYGGLFLLSLLSGKYSHLNLNDFQKSMFRAGHAHAGVLVMLSVIIQILVDMAALGNTLQWMCRISIPLAALIISGGFFFSAMKTGAEKPTSMVALIYAGALLLAGGLIILGIGLIKAGT